MQKLENCGEEESDSMATKMKLEEFNVCDLKECGSAIVHGVVTKLSPVKKSK